MVTFESSAEIRAMLIVWDDVSEFIRTIRARQKQLSEPIPPGDIPIPPEAQNVQAPPPQVNMEDCD